jgi:glutamate synthase domain-containing protein 3
LNDWDNSVNQFVKVFPTDYRQVLEEAKKLTSQQELSEAEKGEAVERN